MATHGGKLAARALRLAGVDTIFTLSGGHVMPIYDGALDEGIRVIDVRHEQAAVHAADAYSRLNPDKLGCAVLTAGPGVTDGVTDPPVAAFVPLVHAQETALRLNGGHCP